LRRQPKPYIIEHAYPAKRTARITYIAATRKPQFPNTNIITHAMPNSSGTATPAYARSPTQSAILDHPTDHIPHSEPLSRTSSLPVPGRYNNPPHSPPLRPSSRVSVPYSAVSSNDDIHTGKLRLSGSSDIRYSCSTFCRIRVFYDVRFRLTSQVW